MRMGHTLLSVLGLILMNTLLNGCGHAEAQKVNATLIADGNTIHMMGGSVTLTCSLDAEDSSTWKYYRWFSHTTSSSGEEIILTNGTYNQGRTISVQKGGIYWCRGVSGNSKVFTEVSNKVTIQKIVVSRALVTPQTPNWQIGESITLRCEIRRVGGPEWEHEWMTPASNTSVSYNQYKIISALPANNGEYRCRGRQREDLYTSTNWSDAFTLTVSQNRPVLAVSPSWLSFGASVHLRCEVEHPSAGWRFYWYKAVPKLSGQPYSFEPLPGSSSVTANHFTTVHGEMHTVGYSCRAGRGSPMHFTEYSEPKFVWSGDSTSQASLTVSPDRVQHFTSDSVSVRCDGSSAEWRVRRVSGKNSLLDQSDWGTMRGATFNTHRLQEGNAVYWCESGSGEFSNAVNITAQKNNIILVSPVGPVTEGDSVTLSCISKARKLGSEVLFYHDDVLIQNGTSGQLNISAVSKSGEGLYRCAVSRKESLQSWLAVKSSASSPLGPVLTGLFVGIAVVVLLLLLWHYKRPKDLLRHRLIQSPSTNQSLSTDQTVNQDESSQQVYSILLHGDLSVYETMTGSNNTQNGRQNDPLESSDYYNLNPQSATGP